MAGYWIAGGLGGNALVTQGLGGGVAWVVDLGIFFEEPITFHRRTGHRSEYAIALDLTKRATRRRRRHRQGRGYSG